MEKKGILLYSGGLDSLLAGKLLLDQGIELIGMHFLLPFVAPDSHPEESVAARHAAQIGLALRHIRLGREYMEMAKDPPHGYGKKMNPCIDCKIYLLKKAREAMLAEGASFVATGEVVGQRPMSQMKHMLNHIEKESGLKEYLLRPLSARLMKPTLAEKNGIVDRDLLLGISGRSRSVQAGLAAEYNIKEYATPAGGCLFTDAFIAPRIKDLFEHVPDFSMVDSYLLGLGRHFRLHENLKIIVGRNESENIELEKYRDEADAYIAPQFKGPSVFMRGSASDDDYRLTGAIIARYGNSGGTDGEIRIYRKDEQARTMIVTGRAENDEIESMRI